jgi:hypothetical protein
MRFCKSGSAFPQPVRPIVHALVNKCDMHLLATEHRIPTPATKRPRSRADVEGFVETNGFPVVISRQIPSWDLDDHRGSSGRGD